MDGNQSRHTTRRAVAGILLAGVLGVATACSGNGGARWKGGGNEQDEPKGPQVSAAVTVPAADARDVPASAEIQYTTQNAASATLELTDAAGKAVAGELRPGTTTWVPGASLAYATTYTVTVTATASGGTTAKTTSTFTTMAKPANTVRVQSNIGDDMVVGVGMPLVLNFDRAIPKDLRDDVQQRLWVTTTPAQEGIWHWFSDRELHYRPKAFWQANTKMNFRIGFGGLPLGGGYFGRADLTIVAGTSDSFIMSVDNATHQMTVTKNGQVVKTIPVSLGRPGMPSSSGTTVIMEKLRNTVFDTSTDPNPANRYVTPVEFAQRLTWGGEFIHAAPWSVAQQGHTNVSHGCVNVSTANAEWLFNNTKVGDPVTTKGTERALQYGNGWTDWSMTWDEYVKGSALPYRPAEATPSTTPVVPASPGA